MNSKTHRVIFRPLRHIPMLVLILLCACENDITLFKPDQKKSYVVFGLLNFTDPLQQVKIRMTSVADAAVIDLSKDSSAFAAPPELQVTMQEWQGNYYATFPLQKVHYPKEPGVFFNTSNDIYQTSFSPFLDMEYKLIVTNPDNGDLITAKIVPVPAPKLGAPNWPWIRYNFSLEGDPFNVRFDEVPRIHVYLIRFLIRYIEVYENGDTLWQTGAFVHQPHFVDDPPEYNPKHENLGSQHNQHMNKKFTYNTFDQTIPDRAGVSFRQLICFEVAVWGGDQNLRNYTEFGLKFNDNRKQLFTNISNGIGFFGACSHSDCTGILPDQAFMDSLPLYYRTSRLKFRTDLFRSRPAPASLNKDSFFSVLKEIRNED